MAITALKVAWAGWVITVAGWLLSPVLNFFMPKILSRLGFDASQKLLELEIHIIPELDNTLRAVDQERMLERGSTSSFAALDKMAAMLRHAREDAEDIFDDADEIESRRSRDIRYDAVKACNRSCVWIARIVWTGSARLLQWASARRSEEPVPVTTSATASEEPVAVAIDIAASDEQAVPVATATASASDEQAVPVATATASASDDQAVPVATPSDSASGEPVLLMASANSSFDVFKNCCRSIFYRLVDAFKAACFYRNWSYEGVGITNKQENATMFDLALTAIARRNLKMRIEKVETTVGEVKRSPLLGIAREIAPEVIASEHRSKIRYANNPKVFGREALRDSIMAKLRQTPHGDVSSSSTSPCYSAIGIYGVAGSGKTTFARYLRDYIEDECEEKPFDTIMCIHVSKTFSVDDIFHEMLKDITKDRHSNISVREDLEEKLKESLRDKRFFLILDDLWVKGKGDSRLQELISPLSVGKKGSKILVTARTRDAAEALCADEPMKMPDLDEDQYFSMLMHRALDGTSVVDDEQFKQVGRVIAGKLHGSPIAAVIVAGRLGANRNITSWKTIAKLDMLNNTMNALWWSYQQLSPDIRRCFEYCNIFPRRFTMKKSDLVHLWTAQGFVKTSGATVDMEDVAEGYIAELVSCSFLQPTWDLGPSFTIHDLLHDLADMVTGTDCFRIENKSSPRGETWKGDIPRDVRHLFIQNYDAELINEEILGFENLRTLIINFVESDTQVEEKVIDSVCKKLLKLRVLAFGFSRKVFMTPTKISVPESICQLKYLHYLAFRTLSDCEITLPSTLKKLHHIQLLDFSRYIWEFTVAELVNLRHIFCGQHVKHLGSPSSLRTLQRFEVSNEQGCELKQLRDLNKLQGKLCIEGLENVKSKEEALEANLAAKEGLTKLELRWGDGDDCGTRCSPKVETEVLEGLCPPVRLQTLHLWNFAGSGYPDWMVGKQNGGPKDLQELNLWRCSQPVPACGLAEAFPHLRVLHLCICGWDALPDNMEHLTSLKYLEIYKCKNIRSLTSLPQSLEEFQLYLCNDELVKSCKTVGHPNWEKIKAAFGSQVILQSDFQLFVASKILKAED